MRIKEPLPAELLIKGQIKIIGPQHFPPGLILPERPFRIIIPQGRNLLHQQVRVATLRGKASVLILNPQVQQQQRRHRLRRPALRGGPRQFLPALHPHRGKHHARPQIPAVFPRATLD